ncbi:MAG: SMC-Scp complex subunit ScpB [Alphaproteobacteria bacterium]
MSEGTNDLRLLEALLFAASGPLDEAALAERLPDGADVAGLLSRLEEDYAGRGVNLVRVAGKWTLRTAEDLSPYLRRHVEVQRKLSRAAVETLAIIAYHQPVTRAEIEEMRGVGISRGTLDILMEAGWIRPKGRRRTPGRPATWVTTDAFLAHFGLDSLDDLPGVGELRAAGLLETGRTAFDPALDERATGENGDTRAGTPEEEAAADGASRTSVRSS